MVADLNLMFPFPPRPPSQTMTDWPFSTRKQVLKGGHYVFFKTHSPLSSFLTDKNLEVHFKEGNLKINYKEEIFMAGPVSEVKKINLDI